MAICTSGTPKAFGSISAWRGNTAACAACALTTLTIGLVVNRIGGFYPTWSVAWENIGPAL